MSLYPKCLNTLKAINMPNFMLLTDSEQFKHNPFFGNIYSHQQQEERNHDLSTMILFRHSVVDWFSSLLIRAQLGSDKGYTMSRPSDSSSLPYSRIRAGPATRNTILGLCDVTQLL